MAIYTRSALKTQIKGRIHNKIGMLVDVNETCNQAVREVLLGQVKNDRNQSITFKLRSSKRKSLLAPNLFNEIYPYAAPLDLDGKYLIDLNPQIIDNRTPDDQFSFVDEETFWRWKDNNNFLVALSNYDMLKTLLISSPINTPTNIIGSLNSLTADGGTWVLFGDAINVATDADDFVKGSGAVSWDISGVGGTTAGIQNSGLTTQDLTALLQRGSIFAWQKFQTITGVTNMKLRLGSSAANYYEMTVTADHSALAFALGYNLLRFDAVNKTIVGTPNPAAITYAALFMTKSSSLINQVGFKSDHIIGKRGSFYEFSYYSKYLWQSAAGAYKENSTSDTDFLNVESDEFPIITEKAIEIAARQVREYRDADDAKTNYNLMGREYSKQYPIQTKIMTGSYYNFRQHNLGGRRFSNGGRNWER